MVQRPAGVVCKVQQRRGPIADRDHLRRFGDSARPAILGPGLSLSPGALVDQLTLELGEGGPAFRPGSMSAWRLRQLEALGFRHHGNYCFLT
jgi:hypothetical protein